MKTYKVYVKEVVLKTYTVCSEDEYPNEDNLFDLDIIDEHEDSTYSFEIERIKEVS